MTDIPSTDDAAKMAVLTHTDTQNGRGGFILCLCGKDMLTITEHADHVAHAVIRAVAPALRAEGRAEALREHRHEWASWIEQHDGNIGATPLTVETIVVALRWENPPFGCAGAKEVAQ